MSDVSRKRAYLTNIGNCLAELRVLTGREVSRDSLLPIDTFEEIRARAKQAEWKNVKRFVIPFAAKSAPRFAAFVRALEQLNSNPVYVWTELSNSCGLLEVESVAGLDYSFDYSVNRQGIVVLITNELRDKMTLDFSENDSGERSLEVEVSGEHWPSATY